MKKRPLFSLLAFCAFALSLPSCTPVTEISQNEIGSSSTPSSMTSTSSSPSEESPASSSSVEMPSPIVTIDNGERADLYVGGTLSLTATLENAQGPVVWSSSDESKATVSASGLVTALGEGEVTITASYEEAKDTIVLHIAKSKGTLLVGQLAEMALVGSFHVDMTFLADGANAVFDSTIHSYWREDRFYNVEYDKDGNISYETDYYRDEEGALCEKVLDPDTNTPVLLRQTDFWGDPERYDDYFANPFLSLPEEAFGNGEELVLEESTATAIGYFLTQYNYPIQNVSLELSANNTIESIVITGLGQGTDVDGYGTLADVLVEAQFDVVTKEEAGAKEIEPREAQEGQEKVDAFFESLKAHNYTLDISIDSNGVVQEERIEVQDDLFIETTEDGKSGYVETADGLMAFDVAGDVLQGDSYSSSGASLSEVLPTFDFPGLMFDVEDSTYTLASDIGMDRYLARFLPIPSNLYIYGTAFDDGTLTLTDKGDGSYVLAYTLTTEAYYGDDVIDSYEITISKIGTTDTGFDKEDYRTPPRQTGWADVDGAESILGSYLPEGILPFYLPEEGGQWSAYFSSIDLSLPSSITGEEAYREYTDILLANGWQYNGTNYYSEESYIYVQENMAYNIAFDIGTSDLEIYFYDATPYTPNALSDWLKENFGDKTNLNYTAHFFASMTPYDAHLEGDYIIMDSETPIGEETFAVETTTYVTKDAYYFRGPTYDELYYTKDGGTTVYRNEKTDDPLIAQGTPSSSPWYNHLYTMNDATNSTDFTEAEEEGITYYSTANSEVLNAIQAVAGVGFTLYYTPSEGLFFLDEENDSLVVIYDAGYEFVEDEGSSTQGTLYLYTGYLTIQDIGTTTIDIDALIGA